MGELADETATGHDEDSIAHADDLGQVTGREQDGTAVGSDRDIILIRHIRGVEGMEDLVLEGKRAEVVLERALVDRDLPCSGNQGYSGGSGLATAGC